MNDTKRFLLQVALAPVNGSRFQPTGFPDIGAATFQRPKAGTDEGWEQCLLLESAQSMANRLEAVGWDAHENRPVDALAGLPYVRVVKEGQFLTASRLEAHRLASPYIKEALDADGRPFGEHLKERLSLTEGQPDDLRTIAQALFRIDPLSLVHGVFFAEKSWPTQPKVTRALMAEIEAADVREAVSGGVKKDHVSPRSSEGAGSREGFGMVPFHRTEWTARSIVASFVIDRAQLRSFGLSEPATDLLDTIARWEIRSLVDEPMRLRTACDLERLDDGDLVDRSGEVLPSRADLEAELRTAIDACRDELGDGEPIELVWSPAKRKKGKAESSEEA